MCRERPVRPVLLVVQETHLARVVPVRLVSPANRGHPHITRAAATHIPEPILFYTIQENRVPLVHRLARQPLASLEARDFPVALETPDRLPHSPGLVRPLMCGETLEHPW